MAIQINTTIKTDEGFEINEIWAWLDQYLVSSNWANVKYYKSKADFQEGNKALNISSLPANIQTDLTNADFWADNLAETFHEKCIAAIEAVTGPNTCTIDKTDPFA